MKGCVGLLVFLVVLAAGGWAFLLFTPMRGSVGLPLTVAILTTIVLGNLWAAVLSLRKLRAVRPPSQWRDGALVGLSGTISAGSGALAAPASGRACALYEYSLRHDSQQPDGTSSQSRNTSEVAAYDGMGMAACAVQGGGSGFRLVGFPLLAHVPKARRSDAEDLRRMAAHLLTSTIAPKPAGVREAYRTLRDLLADADGVVRVDHACAYAFELGPFQERYATDPELAIDALAEQLGRNDYHVEETIVPEGADVTVFGQYGAGDRTIDIGSGLHNFERGLHLGTATAVSRRDLRRSLVTLLVFLVPTVGLTYLFGRALWPAVRSTPYEQQSLRFDDALGAMVRPSHARSVLVQLAQSEAEDVDAIGVLMRLGADPNGGSGGDIHPLQQASRPETVRLLLEGGADPNIADHNSNTPLLRFVEMGDLETVQLLLQHGARPDTTDEYGNTALHRAGVYGHAEIAVALLEAGADPDARARDGSTPLDEARANGHDAVADLLLRRGGGETEVTAANGSPVRPGDPPLRVVDRYLAALHARDPATMKLLDASAVDVDWSAVDWDAMLPGWPTSAGSVEGFANDQRATVRVRGVSAAGDATLPIGFALERNPAVSFDDPLAASEGWRIVRSWIEWGEVR